MAYTLSLIGFTILAYEYMIDFIGNQLFVVFLPIVFLSVIWILLVFYTIAKSPGKVIKELLEFHKIIGILIELLCLILIMLDFNGIIIIP